MPATHKLSIAEINRVRKLKDAQLKREAEAARKALHNKLRRKR